MSLQKRKLKKKLAKQYQIVYDEKVLGQIKSCLYISLHSDQNITFTFNTPHKFIKLMSILICKDVTKIIKDYAVDEVKLELLPVNYDSKLICCKMDNFTTTLQFCYKLHNIYVDRVSSLEYLFGDNVGFNFNLLIVFNEITRVYGGINKQKKNMLFNANKDFVFVESDDESDEDSYYNNNVHKNRFNQKCKHISDNKFELSWTIYQHSLGSNSTIISSLVDVNMSCMLRLIEVFTKLLR